MTERFACEAGEGKYRISAVAIRCGRDWSVCVCGGEKHHVGAVSLAQYEPDRDSATVSTLTAFTHRDDAVSARFAKALSAAFRCNVSVSVGIHVDDASPDELRLLGENSEACLKKLLALMEEVK